MRKRRIIRKRSKRDLGERAKSDAILRIWDKEGNLLVDYGSVTEAGKKRLDKKKLIQDVIN